MNFILENHMISPCYTSSRTYTLTTHTIHTQHTSTQCLYTIQQEQEKNKNIMNNTIKNKNKSKKSLSAHWAVTNLESSLSLTLSPYSSNSVFPYLHCLSIYQSPLHEYGFQRISQKYGFYQILNGF